MLSGELRRNGCLVESLDETQREARATVIRLLADGTYALASASCPTCHTQDFVSLADYDRFGLEYHLVSCRSCGLVQVSPRLDDSSIADFYEHHYRRLYLGGHAKTSGALRAAAKRGRDALGLVREELDGSDLRIVEIGCGMGGQLLAFRDAGFETVGYDLDAQILEQGRTEHHLDLRWGGVSELAADVAAGDRRPDVIAYIHSFEHLSDPESELERLDSVLESDGVLYFELPGLRDAARTMEQFLDEYLHIAHNFHFTRSTLARLMESNGWACLAADQHIHALFKRARSRRTSDPLDETLRTIRRLDAGRAAMRSTEVIAPDQLYRTLIESWSAPDQAHHEVGKRLFDQGDLDGAVAHLGAAYRLQPTRGKYAWWFARALDANGASPTEVAAMYGEAARFLPDNDNCRYLHGNALVNVGRPEEAVGEYGAAIRLNPRRAPYHHRMGLAFYRLGAWELAAEALREAQKLQPDLAYAWHQEGMCWFRLGDYQRAIELYDHAYSVRPVEQFKIRRAEAEERLAATQPSDDAQVPSSETA